MENAMKSLITTILLSLAIGSAHAARLEDVTILHLKSGKDTFELKLQVKGAKKNSYFMVEIVKEDDAAFEKMALVMKKLKKKDSFKLNLEIPSFSVSPPGSHYRSDSVKFSGSSDEDLLIEP
jgi:hypothetical protein